jgi:hypothetical protein
VARASLAALICAARLLAQGPAPAKYYPVKVTKIVGYPTVPLYSYTLSSGYVASSSTLINLKAGSGIKYAIEGNFLYIIDGDGKIHQCHWIAVLPEPPIPSLPPPK